MRTDSHESSSGAPAPSVGIIVLHWGTRETTEACLDSIRRAAYPGARVFLVDNARTLDHAIANRVAPVPLEMLRPPRNLGFAQGCDWGIAAALEAGADYVFLLNNDAVVSQHCLDHLVSVARSTPGAGILSPQIAFRGAIDRVWYRGGRFSLWGLGPRHTASRQRIDTERPPADVDYATGCAMLIDAAVIRRVGGFDARLFAYCEDLDLSLRARRAGFRVLVVPAALAHHAATYTGQRRTQRVYYSVRNLLELMRKHARWYHWIGFIPAFSVQWVGFFVLLACRHRQPDLVAAVGRGLLDGFRGRLGERPSATWESDIDRAKEIKRD